MNSDKAVYTRGPIGRMMIKTAFAMVAGTLAMSGYHLADTFYIGRLEGASPLAAMGFTLPVIMLVGCVFHGLASGVMMTTAQALGGNRKLKASRLVSSGLLLISLFSFILAIIGFFTSAKMVALFGAEGVTLKSAQNYLQIWFLGCITASLSTAGNNLLIAVGDSKVASAMMVAGMILNATLDPLFIFGWGPVPAMGISGAAIATVLSQFCAAFAVLTLLNKRHQLLVFRQLPWRIVKPLWSRIIRYAVPAMIGMLMMPIGASIITAVTAQFGETAVAASTAAGRLEMLAFVFPMALGISLMSMIGQNYGARLYDRIRDTHKFAMSFAFYYLLVMAVIYFGLADYFVRAFSTDEEVRRIMALCLRITPWGFGMIEIHRYAGFFFTGCGRPSVSAWLNGFRILGLMVPLSLLALYFKSLPGLFFARLLADILAGGTGLILSHRLARGLPSDGMPYNTPVQSGNFFQRLPNLLSLLKSGK
ncbi:MAG: MATE family efflux transporter [Lentisphaerae bacterium]|nr:MATE family efflux transporter [Lentisphaerota bacterium]